MLTRDTFVGVGNNTIRGFGFAELPMVVMPTGAFTGEIADPRPEIDKVFDEMVAALTRWESRAKAGMLIKPDPERMVFEASDYQSAVDRMNRHFLANSWSDGLPLTPPTEERVAWLMRGTDRGPDDVLGKVPPGNGVLTTRVLAINAAMAGARPEHMPVIIAAMEAIMDPAFMLGPLQATSNPVTPVFVVNGPIAKELGINSGFGFLGPDPKHPAGAVIGRTTRLIMMNVGNGLAGVTDMAIAGQPGKFTNMVFAEAEDQTPWEPLSVEKGFTPGVNVVTAFNTQGTQNISLFRKLTAKGEPTAERFLLQLALAISVPLQYPWGEPTENIGTIVMNPIFAQSLKELGYTKTQVKEFLYDNVRVPWWQLRDLRFAVDPLPDSLKARGWLPDDAMVRMAASPDQFEVIVAGGYHPSHSVWMQNFSGHTVSKSIQLPAAWLSLLEEAKE